MASTDACIVEACKAAFDKEYIPGTANKDNCSGFVKEVARALGVVLPHTANADAIVDHVKANWSTVADGAEAARLAGTGKLVLAGLKAADHTPARNNGHVAVVVSGDLYRSKYPLVWGGSTGSAQSQGTKSVGEVWNRTDRDNVTYHAYGTLVCPAP
jgi:cell wall-associated NlpC family hydrolase